MNLNKKKTEQNKFLKFLNFFFEHSHFSGERREGNFFKCIHFIFVLFLKILNNKKK
jgi:hypothetical protein